MNRYAFQGSVTRIVIHTNSQMITVLEVYKGVRLT